MELISVPLSAALLTDGRGVGGRFVVAHSESALARGLDLDEHVVVVDPDGEFHAAEVVDIRFELTDTHYELELGVRLRRTWCATDSRARGAPAAVRTATGWTRATCSTCSAGSATPPARTCATTRGAAPAPVPVLSDPSRPTRPV